MIRSVSSNCIGILLDCQSKVAGLEGSVSFRFELNKSQYALVKIKSKELTNRMLMFLTCSAVTVAMSHGSCFNVEKDFVFRRSKSSCILMEGIRVC